MKGSYRIGTFFGIGVYLHFTFLLLLAFLTWADYHTSGSVIEALSSLGFIVALFVCLIMHEYGHALSARRFGIKTKDITLLPIGGVARLERMPDKPWQEFVVAIAGPMVNVVIAILIIGGLSITGSLSEIRSGFLPLTDISASGFWLSLAKINILLILFNMLPAFPMDGGRVVRSLLAMVLPYEKATAFASLLGKIMAVLFVLEVFGINTIPFLDGDGNFILGFIAIFIWMGAASEARYATMKSRLHDIPVSRAMVTNFRTLSPRDTVEWVSELAASGLQQDFPVAEEGRVVGMLFQADLAAGVQRSEPYLKVSDVMRPNVPAVNSTDRLEDVFAQLVSSGFPIIPVVSRELLVGLLPLERLMKAPPRNGNGQETLRQSMPNRQQ